MDEEQRSVSFGRWLHRLEYDIAPAIALAAFALIVAHVQMRGPGRTSLDAVSYVELAGAALALVARRAWPWLVYAAAVILTCAYLGTGHPPGPVMIAPWVALLALVTRTGVRTWVAAMLAGGAVVSIAHGIGNGWTLTIPLFAGIWVAATVAFAAGLRARRSFLAETEARRRWAERSRDEEERRRAAEERLQIAREMHDVVGHSLAVISLQAGVAEHLLDDRPDEVRAAVRAIRQVSRQALAELRVELAALRGDSTAVPERAPVPGMDALPALVSRMRAAGLQVALEVDGDTSRVPEVVGTAAYRIVQESLTNVARHAGKVDASVRARVGEDTVEVVIADQGPGTVNGERIGAGIAGMRDRASALGGTFAAGNQQGGGFRVSAALPIRPV